MADNNKEKFTCADCGKEVEYEGGLAVWAKSHPDKVRCSECFDKYKNGQAKKATSSKGSSKSAETSGSKYTGGTKKVIEASDLKKAYDELRAVFADEIEDVKPFMGAWATTIVLSRK